MAIEIRSIPVLKGKLAKDFIEKADKAFKDYQKYKIEIEKREVYDRIIERFEKGYKLSL